jgi:hypothetical protein
MASPSSGVYTVRVGRLLGACLVLILILPAIGHAQTTGSAEAAAYCAEENATDEASFIACWDNQMMLPEQSAALQCLNAGDPIGVAAFCVYGVGLSPSGQMLAACAYQAGGFNATFVACYGATQLSPEERRIANCVVQNGGNAWSAAACVAGTQITPEQQVVVACGMQTGMEPIAFAGCVGGQLTLNELQKCLKDGVGGDGCFGNDNTVVIAVNNAFHDVVHGPGSNNTESVIARNAWRDLHQGFGPHNDIRKGIEQPLGGKCSFIRNPLGKGC